MKRVSTPARGEDGFVGGFEGLLFGVLLFVMGTLLLAFAWAVVDTKSATGQAAREAARTYVQASDAASAAYDVKVAAAQTLQGYGRDPGRARINLMSGTFGRCDRISVAVSYPAPLLELPIVGALGRGVSVSSRQSELVDPYRSGLPGTATC